MSHWNGLIRSILRPRISGAILICALAVLPSPLAAAAPQTAVDPARALHELLAGNERFASGKPIHPDQDIHRRLELVSGQHPIAVVLGCSDSRVGPELIFDQGLGRIFIVRVAGNVASTMAEASIEYAVEHLGTRLVMVLGHDECGAVKAAIDEPTAVSVPVAKLLAEIQPSVKAAKGMPGRLLDNAIDQNVRTMVARLKTTEPLAHMVAGGKLKIVGARYNLRSGRVSLISD